MQVINRVPSRTENHTTVYFDNRNLMIIHDKYNHLNDGELIKIAKGNHPTIEEADMFIPNRSDRKPLRRLLEDINKLPMSLYKQP